MDYASALSKITPASFVPDLGPARAAAGDETPGVSGIPGVAAANDTGATSFKDTVKQMLDDVNTKITSSDQNTRDLASGKTNDIQKVVTSAEEANLALSFTMAMRTKLVEAYQEVSRMQI